MITVKVYAKCEYVHACMVILEEKVHRFHQILTCLFEHI